MNRALPMVAVLLTSAGVSAAVWTRQASHVSDLPTTEFTAANLKHFETKEQEASGLCPWRNRLADMQKFFPGSDSAVDTNLVVSSQRLAISRQLGRPTTGDENALRVYRIMRNTNCCGTVIARRVRGEYGLIELVIAVDAGSNAIKGAEIQRLREPEPAATALQSKSWLQLFCGLSESSNWQPVANSPLLPPQAKTSAAAITDAARTALVLLATSQRMRVAIPQ
jgi:hypothetical protein